MSVSTAEHRPLEESKAGIGWKRWGPYLSERQWGTVREDYSPTGSRATHSNLAEPSNSAVASYKARLRKAHSEFHIVGTYLAGRVDRAFLLKGRPLAVGSRHV
ncbi:MAG TPA: hypothetical protein VH601_01535 [Bryobacteraceae bacterium]|jgi:hypothetical protein